MVSVRIVPAIPCRHDSREESEQQNVQHGFDAEAQTVAVATARCCCPCATRLRVQPHRALTSIATRPTLTSRVGVRKVSGLPNSAAPFRGTPLAIGICTSKKQLLLSPGEGRHVLIAQQTLHTSCAALPCNGNGAQQLRTMLASNTPHQ